MPEGIDAAEVVIDGFVYKRPEGEPIPEQQNPTFGDIIDELDYNFDRLAYSIVCRAGQDTWLIQEALDAIEGGLADTVMQPSRVTDPNGRRVLATQLLKFDNRQLGERVARQVLIGAGRAQAQEDSAE